MQLRLLTLNVWGLPWPVSRMPETRMRVIASELPALELDAVSFQEVWTPGEREILIDGGRKAGLEHAWFRSGLLYNSGLLVLSRWPIRETRFTHYALGGLPQRLQHMDYYGGKGFSQSVIETPAGDFELFTSHLQATYGNVGHADEYLSHRVAQMVELALAIATSERPVALLGDLNARPYHDEMSVLRGATGLTDVAIALGREPAAWIPSPAHGPRSGRHHKRIDHTLGRAGITLGIRPVEWKRTLDGEFTLGGERFELSDHPGILAELDLHGPGSPLPAPARHALERASRAIERGKQLARQRRAEQRAAGATGAAFALGSGASAHYTRRRWLRRTGFALSGLALLPAVTWLGLADGFTPRELAAFAAVDDKLDKLRELEKQRTR